MDFLPAAALLDENEARYKLVYMLFDITCIDDSDITFLSIHRCNGLVLCENNAG